MIPSRYEGEPVIAIAEEGFINYTALIKITIPDSVMSINIDAFKNTGIWNNTADNSVVYADKWAVGFKGTLMGDLPLKEDIVGIGSGAFHKCNDLTSVKIPESVKIIDYAAFCLCENLKSINIPDSVTKIGSFAFAHCVSLININIPKDLTNIEEDTFNKCSSLTSITIPEKIENISGNVFLLCGNLTIYAEVSVKPDGWVEFPDIGWMTPWYWNPFDRPVFWGCELSVDKTYILSFTKTESSLENPVNYTLSAPYRKGYTFGGWGISAESPVAAYTAENIDTAPNGITLYAIWI